MGLIVDYVVGDRAVISSILLEVHQSLHAIELPMVFVMDGVR